MSNASFTFFSPRDLSWPDLDLATYRLPTITFGNMVTFFGKFYTCSRSFSMRLFKHRLTRLSTTFHSRDSRGSERPPPQRRVDYGNIPAGRGLKGIVHIEKMELLVWKHSTTCKNNIPGITLLKFYQIKKIFTKIIVFYHLPYRKAMMNPSNIAIRSPALSRPDSLPNERMEGMKND